LKNGKPAAVQGASWTQAKAIIDEWLKLVYYKVRGWV